MFLVFDILFSSSRNRYLSAMILQGPKGLSVNILGGTQAHQHTEGTVNEEGKVVEDHPTNQKTDTDGEVLESLVVRPTILFFLEIDWQICTCEFSFKGP